MTALYAEDMKDKGYDEFLSFETEMKNKCPFQERNRQVFSSVSLYVVFDTQR